MKSTAVRGLAVTGAAILAAATYSSQALAQAASTSQTYQVNLAQSNKSGVSGTATVKVDGSNVTVSVRATGLSPNLAHATHIHIGNQSVCPTTAADTNKDGYVDVKEAEPYAGVMKVSLTTSGDTSASSGLTLERMPKADGKGALAYDRTFSLAGGVKAADLAKSTIDIHGISTLFNDKAKYDGDKKSELDGKLPFETTVPAACGKLVSAPVGGASTGAGSVAGIEAPGLLIGGTAAIAGAFGAALIARKQFANHGNQK